MEPIIGVGGRYALDVPSGGRHLKQLLTSEQMSGPHIFEPDWPQHAEEADYKNLARRELLDIEQLASLSAGFVPRAWRGASPIKEDPTDKHTLKDGTITWQKRPRPYADAVNWGVLCDSNGVVGSLMTRWWRRHPGVALATPREWVDFCKRERLPMCAEFRRHFRPPISPVPVSETRKETANREKEELYRGCTLDVLTVLHRCKGVPLIQRQLLKLVAKEIEKTTQGQVKAPKFERFKQLLTKWRRDKDDQLARKLARVLHKRRGPIRDDEEDVIETRLREQAPEFADVLFPNTNRQGSLSSNRS